MSQSALVPCVICGKELQNVMVEAENQPHEGTAFTSYGHYGSTAFDPMNGSMIEINICDECLTAAGKEQKVLWRRRAKALMYDGSIIGWFELSDALAPYVPWNPELDHREDIDDESQQGLDKVNIDDKTDLLEIMRNHTVKLNGGLTPDTIFEEEAQ